MNNLIDNEGNTVYYVVKVNGAAVSPRFSSHQLAEMQITHLEEAHQLIAEVVPVTADGKDLLLG